MKAPKSVSLQKFSEAISKRHHAMERFYDIDEAELERLRLMEVHDRIAANEGTDKDFILAHTIIATPY